MPHALFRHHQRVKRKTSLFMKIFFTLCCGAANDPLQAVESIRSWSCPYYICISKYPTAVFINASPPGRRWPSTPPSYEYCETAQKKFTAVSCRPVMEASENSTLGHEDKNFRWVHLDVYCFALTYIGGVLLFFGTDTGTDTHCFRDTTMRSTSSTHGHKMNTTDKTLPP